MGREDEGQVAPLVVGLVALAAGAMVVMVALAGAQLRRAQARTAADAAALAGVAEGPGAARELAAANGAAVAEIRSEPDAVEVRVAVGDADAAAMARREPVGTAGGGARGGLQPAMLAALARADVLLGEPVPVVSGFRSPAQQRALWENRHTNPYPVARPGRSRHEVGLAVDVPSGFVGRLVEVAARAGLCRPLPQSDPIHFELCPIR